jgi:uncharacterized protein (TIGR02145 family)
VKNRIILAASCIFMMALASLAQETGTFTDPRDGKTYRTVTIGSQIWMAENLAYKAMSGCYASGWDSDNKKANAVKYGYLYEWKAAKKACPPGWHLPTKDEWEILIGYLGGENVAGLEMKSPVGWAEDDAGADSHGFSALPGGSRCDCGDFIFLGEAAHWWTATESDKYCAWKWIVAKGSPQIAIGVYGKSVGGAMSVRCVKD